MENNCRYPYDNLWQSNPIRGYYGTSYFKVRVGGLAIDQILDDIAVVIHKWMERGNEQERKNENVGS